MYKIKNLIKALNICSILILLSSCNGGNEIDYLRQVEWFVKKLIISTSL